MNRLALIVLLAACGREPSPEDLPGLGEEALNALPPTGRQGIKLPPGPTRCLPDETFTATVWACDTVDAMRVQTIEVTNADGSKPWTQGVPRASAMVLNTTNRFINYPGMRFEATGLAAVTEQRYGLFGCDVTEMIGAFATVPASGSRVTFTAVPISLSAPCPAQTLSVSVIAP